MQMMRSLRPLLCWWFILIGLPLAGCQLTGPGRLVYDQDGTRIGIEADPTVSRSDHPVLNSHPAGLTPRELESLLKVIQVSGWSGTLAGIVSTPQPVPLFTPKQLSAIAGHLVAALQEAQPTERIFFSLPKPDVAYSEDRTEGSLFLRGRYLHVVVTDHAAFLRADTGGGEPRDIRDTKGMKLWVASPVQAAMVPDLEEPRWAPFEEVHLSLHVKEVLAREEARALIQASRREGIEASTVPIPSITDSREPGVSREDLQRLIRELTSSNLELRGRLEEQTKRIKQLTEQVEQLRHDLDRAKAKQSPSRKGPDQ